MPHRPVLSPGYRRIAGNWVLYLFLLPCLAYIIIFNYAPMYGIINAFKDFKGARGIWGSPWVGLKHFERFFSSYQFSSLMRNTLSLSLYCLLAAFPPPIILALLLKYTTSGALKKIAQTTTYAPHLISVVVVCGMLITFCSTSGLFNQLLALFGASSAPLLGRQDIYQTIYVLSNVWQHVGYNAVLYIAALTSVDPQLHEAAVMDGANKLQRVFHVDLPCIRPTIVILLIMQLGRLMNIGFEKSYLLQNSLNLEVSEIISTYSYKIGIQSAQYSYATAIGLFNNVINLALLVSVNAVSGRLSESSLW